jgi:hypothetical protein
MRYAIWAENSGKRQVIMIGTKQNNWSIKGYEKELPECLEHLAKPHLTKVGQTIKVYQTDTPFPILSRYLQGEDLDQIESEEIERELEPITRRTLKHIGEVCDRLREKGLDSPDTARRIANRLKKSVLQAIDA